MRVETCLYKGFTNKQLRVTYVYTFEADGDFPTIVERPSGNLVVSASFGIAISEGYDKDRIYIPSNRYYPFSAILNKSVKLVSEHLYELFPDVGRMEFEIDTKALEIFKTEKALATHDMTVTPTTWVDETSSCFPAIQINNTRSMCRIPLEDAISIAELLKTFDPHCYGLSMLRMLGKIE